MVVIASKTKHSRGLLRLLRRPCGPSRNDREEYGASSSGSGITLPSCQGPLARGAGYEAGINRTYLSKLEKGVSYPGLEIIAKLATALEVEPAEFLRISERGSRDQA
ncbi:MAG: helix-turn-helix domain-containing protein [Stellaceae bacterium]